MAFRAPSRSHLPRSLEIGVFHAPVAAQRKGLDRQTDRQTDREYNWGRRSREYHEGGQKVSRARRFIQRAVVIILAVSSPMSATSRSHWPQLAACSETVPNSVRVETSTSSTARSSSHAVHSPAEDLICEVPSWSVEMEFSGDCIQFRYTAYCGSILGPVFCAIPCWAEMCIYSNGWLSVDYRATCIGPICI